MHALRLCSRNDLFRQGDQRQCYPNAGVTPGAKVTLTANAATSGQVFDNWVGNVTVASDNTFTMPSHHVTVAATYKPIGHTHDTGLQTWTSLNDSEHYRNCTASDDPQIAVHTIGSWTNNGDGTHTGTCTDCHCAKTENIPATSGGFSGGGSYAPTTQKPEITIIGSGKAELSADGKTATITAAAGYELTSVVLNGKEMGKVEKLTGLKTGDKATITFRAKADEKDGKEETDKMIAREVSKLRLTARSARTAKKNVKLVVKSDLEGITDAGYTVEYKFYRSTKKSAGYKAVLTKHRPMLIPTAKGARCTTTKSRSWSMTRTVINSADRAEAVQIRKQTLDQIGKEFCNLK